MGPPMISGATPKNPAESGSKIESDAEDPRKTSRKKRPDTKQECVWNTGFIGWHKITTYNPKALPSHTAQMEGN